MTALLAKSCANDFYKEKENCFEEMTHIEDVPSTQGILKKYCLCAILDIMYFLASMTRKIRNTNCKYQMYSFLYDVMYCNVCTGCKYELAEYL